MKISHKLLFALCPMLVLVFIYYSSWRLHLQPWGPKPYVHKESTFPLKVTKPHAKVATDVRVAPTVSLKLTEPKTNPKVTPGPKGPERDGSTNDIIRASMNKIEPKADIPSKDRKGAVVKQEFPGPQETKLSQHDMKAQDGNHSTGTCKNDFAASKMAALFPKFIKIAPMFLDQNFKRLSKVQGYLPPFGFKSQETVINEILNTTKTFGLSPELERLKCKKCIIVGNGGILANKSLGPRIDEYDIVVRLNQAPVKGYTRDVGAKTTLRLTYPEGAFNDTSHYESDSLFVFLGFKPQDFKWLKNIIFGKTLKGIDGFWKSVPVKVPREPSKIRILNPYFIQEAAFQFIGLPLNNGVMGKGNIPTLGTVAITMALHNCDEIAVAGFGYDLNTPHAPLHYYEGVKMSAIKDSWTHNIAKEKEFLRKLVKAKVITDLTKGI
ncbi:ST3 beta-galactoside alpha-2,3-sialyltransferase 3b isoform 4-T4 [Clarias gariepinus]|uniref:ST3 beta-galactoside alpha-2,3-sialyltransferase 3b isoform X1 n=2 Tax=Clarias gariepinus TaxID=13013 RepID=UPI00234CD92F|nr:ST3 beta-galactoside alpha-2,3-sialyltransferase 3b isoform X1 [Clarias gariepinus]